MQHAKCPLCHDMRFIMNISGTPDEYEKARYGNLFISLEAFGLSTTDLQVCQRATTGDLCYCPLCQVGSALADAAKRKYYATLRSMHQVDQNDPVTRLRFGDGSMAPVVAQMEAIQEIQRVIRRKAGLLTLTGGYGTGKTTLIQVACNHFHDIGLSAAYITAYELTQEFQAAARDDTDPRALARLVALLADIPLLVIDEIDKAVRTDFQRDSVFELLDRRYKCRESRATILACNTLPQDSAFSSRLNEYPVVQMGNVSLRPMMRERRMAKEESDDAL